MIPRIILVGLWLLVFHPVLAKSIEQGKLIGSTEVVIPSWFEDSFLDFREDAKNSAKNNRHLLLFFHAKGCPYCQKMLDDNFRAGENSAFIQKHFNSIDIHMGGDREIEYSDEITTTERELSKLLKVRYTPTLLFMNAKNEVVARIDGYRSPREFKQVLHFVQEKAYLKTDFARYRQQHINDAVYKLSDNKDYIVTNDLKKLAQESKPLAILLEDQTCDACERFHQDVLEQNKTQAILKKFNLVRLDASSEQKIITPEGKELSIKEWINKENISYRPAMLFFSDGEEVERLEGLIKSYHFQQLLSYIEEKKYSEYGSWSEYMMKQTQKRLKEGKNVDIWK